MIFINITKQQQIMSHDVIHQKSLLNHFLFNVRDKQARLAQTSSQHHASRFIPLNKTD